MFDWIDIGLHVLVAAALAHLAVFVSKLDSERFARCRRSFGLAGSLIAIGNTVLWPLRELLQHGGRWGGAQSQLEWIAPVFMAVIVTCFLPLRSPWLLAPGKPTPFAP
jgi:hypothetical protein